MVLQLFVLNKATALPKRKEAREDGIYALVGPVASSFPILCNVE